MSIELSFDVHNTSSWTGNLALLEQNIQGAANLWGKVFVGSAKFSVTLNLVTQRNFWPPLVLVISFSQARAMAQIYGRVRRNIRSSPIALKMTAGLPISSLMSRPIIFKMALLSLPTILLCARKPPLGRRI
jgi:hypothetical protein